MLTRKISGKPSQPATNVPSIAPMKPGAIEAKHPPRSYPTIACPIAPHIPATNSNTKSDPRDILLFSFLTPNVRKQGKCQCHSPFVICHLSFVICHLSLIRRRDRRRIIREWALHRQDEIFGTDRGLRCQAEKNDSSGCKKTGGGG